MNKADYPRCKTCENYIYNETLQANVCILISSYIIPVGKNKRVLRLKGKVIEAEPVASEFCPDKDFGCIQHEPREDGV